MSHHSNAFAPCTGCDGRGFLRAGTFAERSFPRCTKCDGCGQTYLDPIPPSPVEKAMAYEFDTGYYC